MSETSVPELKEVQIYADKACQKPIDTIEWDNGYVLTLINGEKEELRNTAKADDVATAVVYLKNKNKWRFGITKISFPDERVKFKIANSWLSLGPVELTISFKVPKNPTLEDVIEKGKITIEGYYVYGAR